MKTKNIRIQRDAKTSFISGTAVSIYDKYLIENNYFWGICPDRHEIYTTDISTSILYLERN